jgi:tetratricopeptide (TPR) repeat protein
MIRPLWVMAGVIAFVAPLSIYAYLPLRAAAEPYMNWGDPTTWDRVWGHIGRVQYKRDYEPAPRTVINLFFQAWMLLRYTLSQFGPLVGVLLLLGLPTLLRRGCGTPWRLLALSTCLIGLGFAWLLNTKPERQEIVANQVFFIPFYLGLALLACGLLERLRLRLQRYLVKTSPRRGAWLVPCACFLPAALALGHNFSDNDFSGYGYAEDHAANVLASLEPEAVIFPSGDHNTFPLIYLHRIERSRPDITIADKYGYIEARDFPGVAQRLRDPDTDAAIGEVDRLPRDAVLQHLLVETDRPVYFTVKTSPPPLPEDIVVDHATQGLLYRMATRPPVAPTSEVWRRYRYRNRDEGFDAPPDYGALNVVTDYHFFRGQALLDEGLVEEAIAAIEQATRLAWGIKEVYNNAGSTVAEAGLLGVAQQYYREALRLDSGYTNARWNLARMASSAGRDEEAVEHFQRLRSSDPDDFRVPGELGFLYLHRLGLTRRAVEHFRASLAINAAQPPIRSVMQEIAARDTEGLFPAVLAADRTQHDFGEVILDERHTTTMTLENVSDRALSVTEVRADCSCTTASLDQQTLGPGESTSVRLAFQEPNHAGKQTRRVTIENDQGPPLVLTIQAEVVSRFAVTPASIELEQVVPGSVHPLQISITDRLGDPVRIEQAVTDLAEVTLPDAPVTQRQKVTLREAGVDPSTAEGTGSVLPVRIVAGADPGERTGAIRITLDGAEPTQLTVPVRLRVRRVVELTPRSVFLRSVEDEGKNRFTVEVDLPDGWEATVTGVRASADWLSLVERPDRLGGKSTLVIELDPATAPQTFNGSIALETDHPHVPPIVIPVYGFIDR